MLFCKECKKIICTLTYIVYLVAVVAVFATQFEGELDEPVKKPSVGADYYGIIKTEDERVIMESAVSYLLYEYEMNTYTTYPLGFIKEVKLNQSERVQMEHIIRKLTDVDNQTVRESLTYDEFLNCMKKVDTILGGGSSYSESGIENNFAKIPMTYEQAMEEYETLLSKDELTNTYTRLFCDYLGIILGIMPIFVCAWLWQADKRAGAEPLIFSRKISSVKLVGTRYLALFTSMFLPVAATYIYTLVKLGSLYSEIGLTIVESFGLMLLWLVPEMLIVISIGTLLTILWSAYGAIFVQIIWWFTNVILKTQLSGSITRGDLVIRHNTLAEVNLFYSQWDTFVLNRIMYLALAIVFLAISVILYDSKRKGKLNGKRMLRKNHTSKSKE